MPDQEPRAHELFSTKKAENEPWLVEKVFVHPAEFEYMAGASSVIIYGRVGSGKTAASRALEQRAVNQGSLIARWQPTLIEDARARGTPAALAELGRVIRRCSQALLEKLSADPTPFNETYKDTQEYLIWFLQHFPPENLSRLSSRLQRMTSTEGGAFLKSILEGSAASAGEAESSIVDDLALALEDIGWAGIWVMVDGLETSLASNKNALIANLEVFLATLEFFESPRLAYKMTMPAELEGPLAKTSGMLRDRLDPFRLVWEPRQLAAIIERRISAASGDATTFDEIYTRANLMAWLEGCGGLTPRGWIEYMRPIADVYLDNLDKGGKRKLAKEEWKTALRRSALQLRYDAELDQVAIGRAEPKTLSPETKAIFQYLYAHQDRFCSKREIYFEAYLPYLAGEGSSLSTNPDTKGIAADPIEYEDLINTAIYRLRQLIEPLPKGEPVFISTGRNQGYKLSLSAFQ